MTPGRSAVAAIAVMVMLGACSNGSSTPTPGSASGSVSTAPTEPTRAISTLTPIPLPPKPPPSGKLLADMRQSSLDAAAGQMEVWIDNDTAGDITPTRIVYRDAHLRRPLRGTRLRLAQSQSERGFAIDLPRRPACGVDATPASGRVEVTFDDQAGRAHTVQVAVTDETDVVGRYATARCTELAVARVAALAWADEVPQTGAGGEGEGEPGTLTLVVTPTGRPGGGTLVLDTVSGTPVLSPVDGDVWNPGVTISSTDAPSRVDLPIKPNRCDDHAFQESAGATAYKINLTLNGVPSQITLRMSIAGAAAAITFARTSCGLLSSVSGG